MSTYEIPGLVVVVLMYVWVDQKVNAVGNLPGVFSARLWAYRRKGGSSRKALWHHAHGQGELRPPHLYAFNVSHFPLL